MTVVSAERIEILHPNTAELSREEWLTLRRLGLGSSDAAPALDMSPWTSSYALWCDKRALVPDSTESERFRWGKLLEPVILAEWVERLPASERLPVERNLMLRSTEYPFMLANPDGLTEREVVEVKTAHSMDEARWDAGVPDHYVIQCHHLMIVGQRRRAVMPVLFGCDHLTEYVVDFDERVAEKVVEGEERFWRRVVENDPPEPDGSDSTMQALRSRYYEVDAARAVELPRDTAELIAIRRSSEAAAKGYREAGDRVKARLMEHLGTAEVGLLDGEKVCTWKADKNGKRSFRFVEKEG